MNYDHKKIEEKWEKIWEEEGTNFVDLVNAKRPFYNLMMFPYPSAEGLHVGNMYAFTGADVMGRFMKMRGYDVFEPIGLDGFGIHSENYAIKVNKHPTEQAKISEERFYKQLHRIGNIFDWKHTVETYDPDYYMWTQWIFLKLFKAGLVERKRAPVNFCPSCKTVLADEQVIDGRCERCSTAVEKKNLEQWFFKITKYAEKLLSNLDKIDWSEKVKTAQRLWIGKSEGVMVSFKVKDLDIHFQMFDSVPQTYMAQTFTVIAPEHPQVYELVRGTEYEKPVMEFVEKIKKKKAAKEFDLEKETEGIFTGRYIEYTPTGKCLPIWVASYVIADYGTGVVNTSAHDERDFAFAKKYNLPLHPVMFPSDHVEAERVKNLEYCYHHAIDGILTEPKEFEGRKWGEVREDIITFIEKKGWGKRTSQYHLRDWLVSRQRYWGAPIPMVNCKKCGWVPVPESELPVLLPNVSDWRPKGTGRGPLAGVAEFVHTKCPNCGGEASRETDVFDTFLDSSWYFLRYPSTRSARSGQVPFDPELTRKWLPVNIYIGGAEHSVLHLMYSRFITMALHDLGYLEFEEPFTKFFAHGLIIKEGAKMSKSKGNIVNPDEYIEKFGADTLRTYLMFLGPFSEGGDFRNFGVAGAYRFLNRVWKWATSQFLMTNDPFDFAQGGQLSKLDNTHRKLQKLIKGVTDDLEKLRYNTAIAKMMEFLNYATKTEVDVETVKTYLKLLAPFAPHMTDELNSQFGEKISIHLSGWPSFDEKVIVEESVTMVIQINGKVRSKITMNNVQCTIQEEVEKLAKEDEKVKPYLAKGVKKTIFVPGRLVNFVV